MMTMMVRGLWGRRPVTLTSPLPLPQALRGNKHNKECLSNKHNNESKTIHQAMFIKAVRWAPGPTLLLENKKVLQNFNWRRSQVFGPKKNAHLLLDTMPWPRPGKIVHKKCFFGPKTAKFGSKLTFLAKYRHFWPIWSNARPKNKADKLPSWFFRDVGTKSFTYSRKN